MYFKKATAVWGKEYVGERNVMLRFTAKIPATKDATISIAADSLYRLYINGKMVSHGPARCGKGWWRVDVLDISDKLAREENTIEIDVLNHGVMSFEYIKQPAFLQAEIVSEDTVLAATGVNGDFTARLNLSKQRVIDRYSYQRPFLEAWQLPVEYSDGVELCELNGINLTARTSDYPALERVYPKTAIAKGKFDYSRDYGEALPNSRHEYEDRPDFSYNTCEIEKLCRKIQYSVKTTEFENTNEAWGADNELALSAGEFKSFEWAAEDTGFLSFNISSQQDSLIYIIWDEIFMEGDIIPQLHTNDWTNVLPVRLKAGEYSFTAIEPRTLKYAKVLCAEGSVKLSGLSLVQYINPNGKKASFKSDDEALNRVYNAAVNTFVQNAVDIFMDCPSRERAGWLCDSFFTGRAEKDLTGANKIEHDFIENFVLATDFPDLPEGIMPMCYPADVMGGEFIPNWNMFLVIELEEYLARTGDRSLVDSAKSRLYALEKYFDGFLNKDGLLEKLEGWVFVEWSQANKWVQDVNFPSNMMYYAMLKAMARMYNEPEFDKKAEKIKSAILSLSFNGKFFRDHMVYDESGVLTTPEDITEVCQYYAFFTGIADKQNFPELLEIIARDFGAGHKCEKTHPGVYTANAFIGNYLRMEVLSSNGYRSQVLPEIKEYFDYMACLTGTLWEHDSTSASCNHGFASHVVHFILRDCLGIEKIDEHNKTIYLNHDFTAPKNCDATFPLKDGQLTVSFKDGIRAVKCSNGYIVE